MCRNISIKLELYKSKRYVTRRRTHVRLKSNISNGHFILRYAYV